MTNENQSAADSRTHPHCAECGDRIGVYEPIWLQHDDGTLRRGGLLTLGDHLDPGDPGARLFHLACLAPGEICQRHAS